MANRYPQKSPNLLPVLRRALQRLTVVRQRASRLEELADGAEQSLIELRDQLELLDDPQPGAISHCPSPPTTSKPSKFLVELAAQRGADKLQLWPLPRGAASVRINDGKVLQLSPNLAALLEKLAQDTGVDGGDLVGWKTFSEVQTHLEQRMGHPFTRHNIEQLLSRLRKALESDGELTRHFIMTHPRLGLRFALRRLSSV